MDAGFFFDELPTVDLGPDIPEARPDAQTTLASLPAELLLDITEYLKYGEVYTLMTVNRLLHGVALQHFYANVHAHPKKVKFPEQLRKDASLEEITRQTRLKNLGIIGGLLARKEHTDTLKFLHLVAAPTDSDNFLPLINTLIRAVISRSSRLRELRLPDFGNHLFTTPLLDFSGLTFPANYFTLSMVLRHPVTQDDVFASFAQDLFERTQPSTLRLLDWSPPEAVGYLTKDTGSNIESFQGRFKLRDTEDFSLEAMTRLFVEKMPNLIDLTIGFETSIPRLDQWNQKMTEVRLYIAISWLVLIRATGHSELDSFPCTIPQEAQATDNKRRNYHWVGQGSRGDQETFKCPIPPSRFYHSRLQRL